MIHFRTNEELEIQRKSNLLVQDAHEVVCKLLRPGVDTLSLDKLIYEFIKDNDATPSFLGFHGYPFSSCISINEAVVHGFPNNRPLAEGDVVSIDIGVFKDGFHGDSAYTYLIKSDNEDLTEKKRLLNVTKQSLYKGIEMAVAGNRLEDISYAIMEHTQLKNKYGVVKELVGHGVGRKLHEEPQVPNYGKRGRGVILKENLAIAIEPMITMGKRDVVTLNDGWTVVTRDGKPAAHYEHSIAIKKGKADILSSFEKIEKAEAENQHLESSFYTMA